MKKAVKRSKLFVVLSAFLSIVLAFSLVGCKEEPVSNPSSQLPATIDVTQKVIEKITSAEDIEYIRYYYHDGTDVHTYEIDETDIDEAIAAISAMELEATTPPIRKAELERQSGFSVSIAGEDYGLPIYEDGSATVIGSYAGRSGDTYVIKNYDEFRAKILKVVEDLEPIW